MKANNIFRIHNSQAVTFLLRRYSCIRKKQAADTMCYVNYLALVKFILGKYTFVNNKKKQKQKLNQND